MWFLVLFVNAAAASDGGPYAVMRINKFHSIRQGNKTKAHNARLTPCYNANPNIPNQRISFSKEMKELESKTFKEIFDERTKGQKIRKNAVYAIEIVMTFSPGAISEEQLPAWRNKSLEWAVSLLGKENVIDCVLHRDEATDHIHITAIPIDEKGRLNAKAFLNGNGRTFSRFQDEYAAAVAEFGLKRGKDKTQTKAKHKSSRAWHAENAAKEAELKAFRKVKEEKHINLDGEIKFNKYYDDFLQKQNTKEPEPIKHIKEQEEEFYI